MGNRAIENKTKKLQEIEAQQKALEQEEEKLNKEIKKEIEARETEEMQAGLFVIWWKLVTSSRLDGKALKAALPEIYSQYCKVSTSRLFTVA